MRTPLGAADMAAFREGLGLPHTRTVTVDVLNRFGQVLTSITPRVDEGSVVVDRDAEVTRVLTLRFVDESHALGFDSQSPDDGALYLDRELRVTDTRRVQTLDDPVSVVVFVGPVVKFSRQGADVNIEAHGRERWSMGNLNHGLNIAKRTNKGTAIRTILGRTGVERFDFPTIAMKMPKKLSLGRMVVPWVQADKIADSLDRQFFYTGDGVCTIRAWSSSAVFTFGDGDDGLLLADPTITDSVENVKNVVRVYGRKPKGKKARIVGEAVAPATSALQPVKIGLNGAPRTLVDERTNPKLRNKRACQAKAETILDDKMRSQQDVAFTCKPVPHLDEGDMCRLRTSDVDVTFRLAKFTLPLGTEGAPEMTVGYLKRRYPSRAAH